MFFRMFQKFHSPNQIKYLLGDFSKVNSYHYNNFYLRAFSISSKTGWSSTAAY
jgi:hypothetical protein